MCHMFATTDEELEQMRRKLRLKKEWEQSRRDSIGPHYDIAKSKRAKAIELGAIPCDTIEDEIRAFEEVEEGRHECD